MGRKMKKRNFRALVRVFGKGSIDTVVEWRTGNVLYSDNLLGKKYSGFGLSRLWYNFYGAELNERENITLYVRSLKRTWLLFGLYLLLLAAVHGVKNWSFPVEQAAELFQYVDKAVNESEYLLINQENQGISFANQDQRGINFRYEVYMDGNFFEESLVNYQYGMNYELQIFGRAAEGIHELRLITYCYNENENFYFDVVEQIFTIEITN